MKNIHNIGKHDIERVNRAFEAFMIGEKRRVIIQNPEPEPRLAPRPRRTVAVVAPKPKVRRPRAKKPFVLTITILHTPNGEGQDVLFVRDGECPKDIDPEALEQHIADFFGSDNEEDYDEEEYEDPE